MTDPTTPMPPDQPAVPADVPPQPAQAPTEAAVPPTAAEPESGAPAEPATPTKHVNARAWAVGGIALLVAFGGGAVIGGLGDGDDARPVSVAATTAAPSPTTAAPTTAAPTTPPPTTAAPSPTKTTPPPKPKPPSYKTLSERQWKLIAKNPDAYIGKTYVVYGRVTQFDAATGTDTFRADVAHRRMADEWDYETNTMFTGLAADLENLVEDDIFRANVTVVSSFSYETQIGGETTVPLLQVDSIKVL